MSAQRELDQDDLAAALAALDATGGFRRLSYQEQAVFILDHACGVATEPTEAVSS